MKYELRINFKDKTNAKRTGKELRQLGLGIKTRIRKIKGQYYLYVWRV